MHNAINRPVPGTRVYGRAILPTPDGERVDTIRVARLYSARGRIWRCFAGCAPTRWNALVFRLPERGPVAFPADAFWFDALRRAARHPGTSTRARRALNRWRRALRAEGVR